MKNIFIIGLILSLFGCVSEKAQKEIEQKLHNRIAEFTTEKFNIKNIGIYTNEGSMNLNSYRAHFTSKNDTNVQFKTFFWYKKGDLSLSRKGFYFEFDLAKANVENKYLLEKFIYTRFKNVRNLSVRGNHIAFICSNSISDATIELEIKKARAFALEACKKIKMTLSFQIGYTTLSEKEFKKVNYTPEFRYTISNFNDKGQFILENFQLVDNSKLYRDLKSTIHSFIKKNKMKELGQNVKVVFPIKKIYYSFVKRREDSTSFSHLRFDWIDFKAYIRDTYQSPYDENNKYSGEINSCTKEIIWDE